MCLSHYCVFLTKHWNHTSFSIIRKRLESGVDSNLFIETSFELRESSRCPKRCFPQINSTFFRSVTTFSWENILIQARSVLVFLGQSRCYKLDFRLRGGWFKFWKIQQRLIDFWSFFINYIHVLSTLWISCMEKP